MRVRFLEALTGRRLGGALFVLCGLVIAAVVLWPEGEPERGRAPKIQPARIVSIPELGLAFAHPRTWKQAVAGRVVRVRSPDSSTLLTFSSPVAGRHSDQVKADLKDALRKRLEPATIVRDGPAKIGVRKATSFEIEGIGTQGTTRVLVLITSTKWRTYAVSLLTPERPSAKRLAEAQQILATVRLSKPLVVSK